MRWRLILSAAALAGALAAPAAAQDATTTADVRCAVAAVALAGSAGSNATLQQQATMAALYFIGKLDGRTPNLDLEASIRAEMTKMSQPDMAAEAQRCGQQLMSRGQALQTIGEHFKAQGPAPPAKK
jgi:hypothetical protein